VLCPSEPCWAQHASEDAVFRPCSVSAMRACAAVGSNSRSRSFIFCVYTWFLTSLHVAETAFKLSK
jgi:hypothetical protein